MRVRVPIVVLSLLALPVSALAQDPPPRIPIVVFDLRGSFAHFPDTQALADSRGMSLSELPGAGFGLQAGVHVYPLKWKVVTFGIGAEVAANRSTFTPNEAAASSGLRASEEKFLAFSPQLSLNFGSGHGWSFLSAGPGVAQWSLIPEGQEPFPGDTNRLKTFNYGGGARWFAKPHLAFTFDLRFYVIAPGEPYLGHPGSPRTTLRIISAGVSFK